tara:strand:- start:668 stop:1327 length:660 start_codon:yes stop_codon:yes gene_type:complete
MKHNLFLLILISFTLFPVIAESWEYENKVLHPYCFQTEWASSDNVQEFYEQFMGIKENYYRTKEFEDFSLNIGKYWGKNITTFEPIRASWGEEIELAVSMESCLTKNSNEFGFKSKVVRWGINHDEWVTSSEERDEYSYKILKEISLEQCQNMAPYIEGQCVQSNLLNIFDWGGGSASWSSFQIFGLFKMSNNDEYIFPLKRFRSEDEEEFKALFQNTQ